MITSSILLKGGNGIFKELCNSRWTHCNWKFHCNSYKKFTTQNCTIIKPLCTKGKLLVVCSRRLLSFWRKSPKKIRSVPKSDIYKLLNLAKPVKWKLGAAVGLLLISSSVTMVVPFSVGKLIDQMYSPESFDPEKVKQFCYILLSIFLIGGLANFGRVYLFQTAGQRIVQNLRKALFTAIIKQDMKFFDKSKTGELLNRLSADTAIVGRTVTENISDGLRSTAMALIGTSMMFYVSTELALVGLAIVPPVAVLAVVYGRYVKSISKKVQDSLADASNIAEERLSNIRVVRAFAKEEREAAQYRDKIEDIMQLIYKESLARGVFFGLTGFSGNIIILSVLYKGGLLMTESHISVGLLTSFLLYAAYVGIAMGGLSSFYSETMKGLGASSRLWELLERQPEIPIHAAHLLRPKDIGNVEFRNVSFSYPTRPDVAVFKDLSLSIPSGKVTAVVGMSGSGKSTVGALLLRLYDCSGGNILIDGVNINAICPMWLRCQIGTVSQEPVLFSCSIKDNICYASDNPDSVPYDHIYKVAQEANALQFIESFPDKFDTLVGERGVMLSGGQKQRLAIARALLKNPKLLLLDEATSALDSESEHLVQEALDRVMVGRTVVTIAHRLSTIKHADQIVVLGDGRIVESGGYTELMSLDGGIFQKLVQKQTFAS